MYRSTVVLSVALLFLSGPSLNRAAAIPTIRCGELRGQIISQSDPLCNTTGIGTPSINLIPMPGGDPSTRARFPFYMNGDSPIGLVFMDFDHIGLIPNIVVNQILGQASRAVTASIARHPGLVHLPLMDEMEWKPVSRATLIIEPAAPNMVYGDLNRLFRALALWAQQYETEECSFEIWAAPGRREMKRLGTGYFLLAT